MSNTRPRALGTTLRDLGTRGASRGLAGGLSIARRVLPTAEGTPGRLLRRAASPVNHAIHALDQRAYRNATAAYYRVSESQVRERLSADPDDGALWFDLGQCLSSQHRYEEAIDAWFTAAERGFSFEGVSYSLQGNPEALALAGADRHVSRMRAFAAARPDSASAQLTVGASLVDCGQLQVGRQLIRDGYRLLFEERWPELAIAAEDADTSLAPSFLIIGPQKTATSSLYEMLTQHPAVVPAARKELQFWTLRADRGADVYDAYFPPLDQPTGLITGEASPMYLPSAAALAGVVGRFPDIKVIALRRDPVARAYSHFQMASRQRADRRDFSAAIERELRLIGDTPPLSPDEVEVAPGSQYVSTSCVLPHIKMWVEELGPEQVLVIDSGYFAQHQQATLDAVHQFLGLAPSTLADDTDRNVGEYSPIDAATADRLRAWFAPHEAALDAFLATHPTKIPA